MTDVAFDRRITSHMSVGMIRYVRELERLLPRVAPDLAFDFIGAGDNFDLAEQVQLPLAAARGGARLLHVPSPYVPLVTVTPLVVTIHDLIDLHFPAYAKGRVQPYYRYAVGPVLRRAQRVLTDDDRTADDLVRLLRVDRARIRVIALGVDLPRPLPPAASRARPYFLYAGNRRPHKNVALLARAWANIPAELDVDLVLAGAPASDEYAAFTRERGGIVFVGECSEDDLLGLYQSAVAYVHPALREGFGLPLLEAMRLGTPVIASHGALPAVLAPHAYAFDAGDVDELRDLLWRAIEEPERFRQFAEAAWAATAELTWEATARATADVYRELLA